MGTSDRCGATCGGPSDEFSAFGQKFFLDDFRGRFFYFGRFVGLVRFGVRECG